MAIGAAVVSIGASIYQGVSANKEAKRQGRLTQQQSALELEEAYREAGITEEENRKFIKSQALAFTKNGVSLEGSPWLVLQESQQQSAEEVAAIKKRGYALYNKGMMDAKTMKNQGTAALISGLGQAASGASSLYSKFSTTTSNTRAAVK